MPSLPFPRRLQLVKLLRAHGLRDVERLREDEMKEALARLSILMPDLVSETPFVQAPSSQLHGASSSFPGDAPAVADDDEDRYMLPRFREPRAFLPNNERTFLRAIAVKPRVVFATWDTRWDLPDGPARLDVYAADVLGDAPATDAILKRRLFSVGVDRTAPGWYIDVPADRLALVLRLVISAGGDDVVVATSNVTLTPPARPAPPGPLWMATLQPGVDRRSLRGAGLLKPFLPDGAAVEERGSALPESVLLGQSMVADPPSSSFRFLGHTEEERPSSSSRASRSSAPSSSSPSSSSLSSSSHAAARVEVRQ